MVTTATSQLQPVAVLSNAAEQVLSWMTELPGRLAPGEIHNLQHSDKAQRVRALAQHLRAVLQLDQGNNYPSAFALLRVALEHHLVDELIFRGRHLRQVYWGVTPEMWVDWQQDRAAGIDGADDIVDWKRTNRHGGTVTINRRELFSEPDEHGVRDEISIYYFLVLQDFDPLCPPPGSVNLPTQEHPMDADVATSRAERNRDWYRNYLSWQSIRGSLLGENFLTDDEAVQLDVHYRFLFSYVHPISDRDHATYGLNATGPRPNTPTSTLILLYVLTLASREIQDFITMTKLEPTVGIIDGDDLAAGVATLHQLAAPLWFPGQTPHQYDWNTTAQRDRMEAMRAHEPDPPARAEPLYYNDPLRRVTALLSGWSTS